MRQRTRIYGRSAQLGERCVRIPMVAHRPASFSPWFRRGFSLNSSKIGKLENQLFVAKTRKKRQYGPVAQLGAHYIRIVGVVGSNPIRSTILRKITAKLAVIFRLTTIIPQTEENSDHFWDPQAVSSDAPRLRVFVLYACWSRQFCSDLIVVSQQVTGGDLAGINQYANADRQNSSEISRYPYRAAFSFLMAYSPLICHMYCLNYF